jgi:hypothetical protein
MYQPQIDSKKEFIKKLLLNRLPLKKFPERVCTDFILKEPSFLPFGGRYIGFEQYENLLPRLMDYYNFNNFKFLDVYADDNVVFATLKIGLQNSEDTITLCEQFTFKDEKIQEIKVFVFN